MSVPAMLLGSYVTFGLGFALFFVTLGAARIDPTAKSATWGFRVLLIPGSTLLWPLLAMRWIKGDAPPRECTAHKRLAAGTSTASQRP